MYNHEANTLFEALGISEKDLDAANEIAESILNHFASAKRRSQVVEILEDFIRSENFSSRIKAVILIFIMDVLQTSTQTDSPTDPNLGLYDDYK